MPFVAEREVFLERVAYRLEAPADVSLDVMRCDGRHGASGPPNGEAKQPDSTQLDAWSLPKPSRTPRARHRRSAVFPHCGCDNPDAVGTPALLTVRRRRIVGSASWIPCRWLMSSPRGQTCAGTARTFGNPRPVVWHADWIALRTFSKRCPWPSVSVF